MHSTPSEQWGRGPLALFAAALLSALVMAAHVTINASTTPTTAPSSFAALGSLRTQFAAESCQPLDPQVIVYNRIPKAGSTTLISLLTKLSKANNYSLVLPTPYYDHDAARDAIFSALSTGTRTVVCNHFNFPELLYGSQVAYFNVMRNPIDRCASFYYYTRYGDRSRELKNQVLEEYGAQTLDECVARPFEDVRSCFNCQPDTQALAFCGREEGECSKLPSEEILSRAWSNVKAHYFVGITEDLQGTVETLETLYPTFFKGMTAAMAETKPKKVSSSREEYIEPSEAARDVVEKWAAVDMELYRRVEERYRKLRQTCLLQN